MSAPETPQQRATLVQLARVLERQIARRRRYRAQLAQLDDDIRRTRKLLADLMAPDPAYSAELGDLPVHKTNSNAPSEGRETC